MFNDNLFKKSFYQNIMNLLGLRTDEQYDFLYILNRKLKNNYMCTYDNKQMIRIDNINNIKNNCDEKPIIRFHPLSKIEKSCSHLLIDDSIHLYLRNLIYNIFIQIITIKDGTHPYKVPFWLDNNQLDSLPSLTKNTRYKLLNLFNIVSATSFSKNLIRFEINFNNSPKEAKVNFKYPLYNMLKSIKNNTIFGIHLEGDEIKLFKQIYENYIISTIDNLFKESIKIPTQSDQFPQFYTLMIIKLMLEEIYCKKYNICFIYNFKNNIKNNIKIYKDMLSDLNHYTQYDVFTTFDNIYKEKDQELDEEAYKNELQIRKESEPDWLLLKDNIVKEKNRLVSNEEINSRFNKQYWNKYIQKISTLNVNRDIESLILDNERMKNQAELAEILDMQKLVLNIINGESGRLWFDLRTKKYYFRSEYNGEIVDKDKKGITEILNIAMQKNLPKYNIYDTDFLNHVIEVVLIESIDDIAKNKLKKEYEISQVVKVLLFTKTMPSINGDVFNLEFTEEIFQSDTDLLFKRNRFVPNKYLIKRYAQKSLGYVSYQEETFIERFIYHLVKENQELSNYIINWLAYYFQNLQKSKTALVLLGDQYLTQNIFWDIIIKEIFSKQYCTTIDDKECNTTLMSDIAKDKLSFHIGDIQNADTKFDDITLAEVVEDLIIKQSLIDEDDNEIVIYGQLLITAKNPKPYLKHALSKCIVMDVSDMDTVLEKLDLEDRTELKGKITKKDLDNFTDFLLSYNVDNDKATNKIDTEARQQLKENKTIPNINKADIDKDINDFIQAIKDKNIDYFEKAKKLEDGKQYTHMKNAFEKDDGYFIGQYLLDFYNAVHEQKFHKKKEFMDRLKDKDDMFKQEVKTLKIQTIDGKETALFQAPKTTKETGNKELYKINNYKMAKDITIPTGAIQFSSQENITKYSFEDEQDISIWKEKIKENKDKNKAK